jgi:5-methylcytosine-specific restriction endonuclease McrA
MLRDEGRCHVCGEYGSDEVDHVIPLSEGGADDMDNRAPIHSTPCHERKTAEEARRVRA